MTEAQEKQIVQVIADVLNVPASQAPPDRSPQNVQGWDSVQHLNLVLAIEQAAGIQLDPEDVEEMQSIGAILDLVRKKMA
jgi:acyl carrier protein